jgi:hypothetical protein
MSDTTIAVSNGAQLRAGDRLTVESTIWHWSMRWTWPIWAHLPVRMQLAFKRFAWRVGLIRMAQKTLTVTKMTHNTMTLERTNYRPPNHGI